MRLGRAEIMERIPHRPPFLFLDYVDELEEGVSATGVATVREDDPVFAGHFPGDPVMPGVLLIECIAQVAAVAFSPPRAANQPFSMKYFVKIDGVSFKKPVRPGATLRIHVNLVRRLGRFIRVRGRIQEGPATVAEGSLVLYDSKRLEGAADETTS